MCIFTKAGFKLPMKRYELYLKPLNQDLSINVLTIYYQQFTLFK